jgi:SAM-dependent methyltransferase
MPPDPGPDAERIRERRASSFGAVAAAYAEHRPDYAAAAVDWALAPVRDRRPVRVADLGAGTGKLTAALVRPGAEVTAVEPDPAMLAELRRSLPDVRALPGRAEDIPLPDGSADAVVAGQAAHWFDMGRALPEIARVLVPGGVLATLWNTVDDDTQWVAGLDRASRGLADVSLSKWRAQVGNAPLVRLGPSEPEVFGAAETGEFPHGQRRTAESFVATLATHSAVLVMEDAERDRLLGEVREYLASRPETATGEFTVPLVTAVVRVIRA